MARLTVQNLERYYEDGHVTIDSVFSEKVMNYAIKDAMSWAEEQLPTLEGKQRLWSMESRSGDVLRKLENPAHLRALFSEMAASPRLLELVCAVVGDEPSIFFSQIFFKAPWSGPKPLHQDNHYLKPQDGRQDFGDDLVTAWIALEDAQPENGCLIYARGSHRKGLFKHEAPKDAPFHEQVCTEALRAYAVESVPVLQGGVSLHHGRVVHGSRPNRSERWRRAITIHYVRNPKRTKGR